MFVVVLLDDESEGRPARRGARGRARARIAGRRIRNSRAGRGASCAAGRIVSSPWCRPACAPVRAARGHSPRCATSPMGCDPIKTN